MGRDEENRMRMAPIGPDGIKGRIAEIKAKIESLSPNDEAPFEPAPQPKPSALLASSSRGIPAALQGALVKNPILAKLAGNEPLNPLAGGLGLSAAVPRGREAWLSAIQSAAEKNGLDPVLFEELVAQESAFNPLARSKAGAMGLTQLMPETAKMLGVSDPWNPEENLNGGARYLAQMLKEFDGSESLALAAYNAGPGRVRRTGGIPPIAETENYVKSITAKVESRRS